jgi:sugar lactone lactonase YvrE
MAKLKFDRNAILLGLLILIVVGVVFLIRGVHDEGFAEDIVVSTFAGGRVISWGSDDKILPSADGKGKNACLYGIGKLTIDNENNIYTIAMRAIRKIRPDGTVSTIVTDILNDPKGITIDKSGILYVSVTGAIIKISLDGTITTFAGTYKGIKAGNNIPRFFNLYSIIIDKSGVLYGTTIDTNIIYKITSDGTVSTLAGSGQRGSTNGPGLNATFTAPSGITIDSTGNLYVVDGQGSKIRKITPDGTVSTFASYKDGLIMFNETNDITIDTAGNLYVTQDNYIVVKITPDGSPSIFAGIKDNRGFNNGPALSARFGGISGIAIDSNRNLYVSENNTIRKIGSYTDPGIMISTIAGAPPGSDTSKIGFKDGIGTSASFNRPGDIISDSSGNFYVTDAYNHAIRKITPDGTVSTIAGTGKEGFTDGIGTSASFNAPFAITIDNSNNLYVCDAGNHAIRKITKGGVVSTIAGTGRYGFTNGIGTSASFNSPNGITIDNLNNLYVTDNGNYAVRKITPDGTVSTFAGNGKSKVIDGTGTNASFSSVSGITIDKNNNLYLPETYTYIIRKITPDGTVSIFAGSYKEYSSRFGFASPIIDGPIASARFTMPYGLTFDSNGNLYLFDYYNTIRKITPDGMVQTVVIFNNTGSFVDGNENVGGLAYARRFVFDSNGNIYIADWNFNAIRKITFGPEKKDCILDTANPYTLGPCSVTCGTGTQTKTPNVKTPATGGGSCPASSTQPCTMPECGVDCKVGPWSEWGQCKGACGAGGGTQTRTRTVTEANSTGRKCTPDELKTTQTQPCDLPECGVDCKVGPWSEWGQCSGACGKGNGTQTRTRNVKDGNSTGKKCSADELRTTESKTCDMPECGVDCVVGPWSSWSECNGSCGKGNGTQTKSRSVKDGNATGRKCTADELKTTESQKCDMPDCPVHCNVGKWSNWTPAGQQGGVYMKKRTRPVISGNATGSQCTLAQQRTEEIVPICSKGIEDDGSESVSGPAVAPAPAPAPSPAPIPVQPPPPVQPPVRPPPPVQPPQPPVRPTPPVQQKNSLPKCGQVQEPGFFSKLFSIFLK